MQYNSNISTEPLITPQALEQEFPLSVQSIESVLESRRTVTHIMQGKDDRFLMIVGPCSIHDPQAALEYAELLRAAAIRFADELYIVMRVYFEKPRTTVGWKGLISDPFLNGSFDMNSGLRIARQLLLDLNKLGMPAATEFLDVIIPHYLSDLISWCAIGARTSASQIHRELASGLPMTVGFKNSIDGNIKIAVDAVQVASLPHHFLSIDNKGSPTIIHTKGNHTCHIVLRGSTHEPNFETPYIENAARTLKEAGLIPRLMVDCSHGNSMKNYQLQYNVINSVISQLKNSNVISGIMLESNLVAGFQSLDSSAPLIYGQSITDGCLSWKETLSLLEKLACAIRLRKRVLHPV